MLNMTFSQNELSQTEPYLGVNGASGASKFSRILILAGIGIFFASAILILFILGKSKSTAKTPASFKDNEEFVKFCELKYQEYNRLKNDYTVPLEVIGKFIQEYLDKGCHVVKSLE